MSDLSDRFFILLIAAVGFGSIVLWFGGYVEAEMGGLSRELAFVGLGLLMLLILVGVWLEATHLDREREREGS